MEIISEGEGELIGWHDPDDAREWVQKNKTRALVDKTMTAKEAVTKFVKDGDYIASGGFGHVRISMAIVYEIIRQKRRNLILAGKTAVHDLDLLVGSSCVCKVEPAYSFGHELRGLSPASRRMVQSGRCKIASEISNAGYQWRFLAAMMGVPFIPARNMLGTDTGKYSCTKGSERPVYRTSDHSYPGSLSRLRFYSRYPLRQIWQLPNRWRAYGRFRTVTRGPPPYYYHRTGR